MTSRKRTLPPNVHANRGWHWLVRQVDGKRTWIKLGKFGALGARYLSAESTAELERLRGAQQQTGMQALFDRYQSRVMPKKAAKTRTGQLPQLRRLGEKFGSTEPDRIKPKHIAQYLDHGQDNGRAVLANREMALLSDVFRHAIRWGLADTNPCTGVMRNKELPRERAVSDAEFWAVHSIARPVVQLAMELALLTGQRIGDLLTLRRSALEPRGIHIKQGKTRKALLITWTDPLRDLINRCKARAEAVGCMAHDLPLLVGDRGSHFTPSGFATLWQRTMVTYAQSGGERFTFHDLRSLSADKHATGEHLGHTDPKTTRRIYNRRPRQVDPASV